LGVRLKKGLMKGLFRLRALGLLTMLLLLLLLLVFRQFEKAERGCQMVVGSGDINITGEGEEATEGSTRAAMVGDQVGDVLCGSSWLFFRISLMRS